MVRRGERLEEGLGLEGSSPVFIITCVVARLTFFLKPGSHPSQYTYTDMERESNEPAHDMLDGRDWRWGKD